MGAQQGKTYTAGFHVLNVQANSPGEEAGLVSFFDYIVSANGADLDRENSFAEILKEHVGKPVELCVYSSRDEGVRVTTVTPRDNWGGKGLLGLSIRFCQLKGAGEFVWHILDVYPQSPATTAGLIAHTDYIVGAADVVFSSSDDFFNLINAKMGEVVKLYVYNSTTEEIRLVNIVPNRNWGGEGSLGCDVGYGLLHKIPAATGKAKSKPIVKPASSSDDLGPSEFASTPLITPTASAILTASPPSTPPVQVSSAVQSQPSPPVSVLPPPTTTAPPSLVVVPATASPVISAATLPAVSTPPLPTFVNPIVTPVAAVPTTGLSTPPTIPSTTPQITPAAATSSSSSVSLPSTEQLQKQLEQLKLQQQRLQELRNKQLGITPPATSTSSPSNAPANAAIASSGSDPSLAPAQFSAQTLTQLKLQALAAKQQQQ